MAARLLLKTLLNLPIAMTHPLIPSIIDLAQPVAAELGLTVVTALFYTNERPPILRVDIRSLEAETGLEDCERMSRSLEAALDEAELIPFPYNLEISSPGAANTLTTDREFEVFRGFTISVQLHQPLKGKTAFKGQLKERDDTSIHLTQKGRVVNIPRELVSAVVLDSD
jgi:ribosome maturation factor RimP